MSTETDLRETLKNRIIEISKNNPLESIKLSMENNFIGVVPGFRVLTRVKDLTRALEKIDRKGYTHINQFTDLTGMKILTRNLNDLYKIVDHINKTYHPHSADDYIKHPKVTGYKGYHTNFYYNGMNVEVQLQTHAIERASQITHDRFYKQMPGNITGQLVKLFKKILPKSITTPIINSIQNIIFRTVVPYDILRKQGLQGLTQYLKDVKRFSVIDFTPKQEPAPLGKDERITIKENVKEYKVKYINENTTVAIKEINNKFGHNLSMSEIKELRQKIGQEIDNNSIADIELFRKLDRVFTDMKLTDTRIRSQQVEQKSIEVDLKKNIEMEV